MKKLTLSKETIRRLDESHLQDINGGKILEKYVPTEFTSWKCFLDTVATETDGCPCWE